MHVAAGHRVAHDSAYQTRLAPSPECVDVCAYGCVCVYTVCVCMVVKYKPVVPPLRTCSSSATTENRVWFSRLRRRGCSRQAVMAHEIGRPKVPGWR